MSDITDPRDNGEGRDAGDGDEGRLRGGPPGASRGAKDGRGAPSGDRAPGRGSAVPGRTAEQIRHELDEELRFDLDMRTAELIAEGLGEEEARRRAEEEFGDVEYTHRYCTDLDLAAERSRRRAEWLAELWQDARLTFRSMVREPGFAFVVLLTLALGIGANTAVFSVLQKVLIAQLPYEEPDRLVRLYGGAAGVPGAQQMLSPAEIAALQQSDAFEDVAAFGNYGGLTRVGDGPAEMWGGVQVGPAFFRTLGVRPLLGRTIDDRDAGPEAVPVVVLSHAVWQRSFGGDPAVVGREVRLNGRTTTVIGVLPPGFVSPDRDPEVWTPLDLSRMLRAQVTARQGRAFRAIGRLRDGVTPEAARAALALVEQRLRAAYPADDEIAAPSAVPLRDDMVGSVRPILLVVMGAAGLVLLLCCVNLAELFLSRAVARRRELAIRAAVGAGRGRLVRQMLTESAVIAVAGGALGVVLAFWWKGALVEIVTLLLPSTRDVPMDLGVLGFALAASVLTALGFGLVPALAGTRTDTRDVLTESSRGASGGRATLRATRLLVAAQVALAVVLLIGAVLLGRTLVTLQRAGTGFDTGPELLTFGVNLSSQAYESEERRSAFFDAYLQRLRSLPAARSVGAIGVSPWNGYTAFGADSLFVEGRQADGSAEMASRVTVSEDWFATLGIPVLRGRPFTTADAPGSPRVTVVSESFAERYWPGGDALGQRLRIGRSDAEVLEVVGVVGDVRARPSQDVRPTVYVPLRQNPIGGAEFVIRAAGSGLSLIPGVRSELHRIDGELPVAAPRTLDEIFDGMLAGQRLPVLVTGAFALLALALATLGVYGMMAYSVAARRRELGIRVALGARRVNVLGLVLRQGMAMAALGTVTGLAIAAAASRTLSRLLVGVTPHDTATFMTVPLVLILVSCAACLIPARRSVRIEPVEALRAD